MGKIKSRYLGTGAAGLALLAAATVFTGSWEGRRLTAYQDSGGVWTICDGKTSGVYPGMTATPEQCDKWTQEDLILHERKLLACAPEMLDIPGDTYVAINDWAYNVGAGAACKSTLIRKVKAGDLLGACNELSRWVYVKGVRVTGLYNRRVKGTPGRISERALCLRGLD